MPPKHDTAGWVKWTIGLMVPALLALGSYALAQDRKVTTLEVQQKYTDQKVTDTLQRVERHLDKIEPIVESMKRHMDIDEQGWKAAAAPR